MRAADYIFRTLADWNVRHIFFVSGGGAMHLNDALGREKRIQYVCALHEQGAAIAAEGYARIAGTPGVINVTTGPGGTNALTGVAGAWLDSIPMVVISGQIKNATCVRSFPELKLRALGDQELNIVDVVKPITKYAAMIQRPEDVRYHLERAWYLAQSGRPGPVWLDVPLDVQAAPISDPASLRAYDPAEDAEENRADTQETPAETWDLLLERLQNAQRPVILAGGGLTLAGMRAEFLELAEKLQIPVLTAISGVDLIPSDHPLFFGRPGILGERGANFVLQNSDFLLVLGARMSIRIIGYAFGTVAREAFKVMVDADDAELNKPTFQPDLKIHANLKRFVPAFLEKVTPKAVPEWLNYCQRVRAKYPVVTQAHRERIDYVSSYAFPELLGKLLKGNEIVVTGNGTAYTSTFQSIGLKPGVRMFSNMACASMGYDLPAAIGASFAAGPDRDVICITGDGSIQMNLQEMQTVLNYGLPIKLFVYENGGYLSIKLTQRAFFQGNFVGSTPESGVRLPDMKRLAGAFGWKTFELATNQDAQRLLPEILETPGPVFCEVHTDPFEVLGPKAASKALPEGSMVSQPLENLAPFLPREEFLENMLINPLD